jgi:hypothetical protein
MAPFHLRSFYIANLFFIGSCSFRNVLRKSTFLSASLAANSISNPPSKILSKAANSMPQVQAQFISSKHLVT